MQYQERNLHNLILVNNQNNSTKAKLKNTKYINNMKKMRGCQRVSLKNFP